MSDLHVAAPDLAEQITEYEALTGPASPDRMAAVLTAAYDLTPKIANGADQ